MPKIGITERGDAGLDFSWINKSKKYDGVILITKCLSHKFIKEAKKVNCIVHATITGFGNTPFEPNVPSITESSAYFHHLVDTLGKDRVVLRIDPIFPYENGELIAHEVYKVLHTKSKDKTRVRVSFLDNYPHVKARFIDAGIKPLSYNFHTSLSERKRILKMFPDAEVCGEPGLKCVGCISEKDLEILNIKKPKITPIEFQRPECKYLGIKHEMLIRRKQCPNKCLYCYWK